MGTYKVQDNGKAQSGLSVGDKVVTGGGTYEITGVKADGSYESKLTDKNTTTKNYSGSYSSGSSSKGSSSGSSSGSSWTSQRDRDNETISKPGGTLYYDDGRAAVHNAGKPWQDGVDYAAEAAKYAAIGDWGGVNDILMRREAKMNDLGITGVQSNLEVWKELNDKYNGPSAGKSLSDMQAGSDQAYGVGGSPWNPTNTDTQTPALNQYPLTGNSVIGGSGSAGGVGGGYGTDISDVSQYLRDMYAQQAAAQLAALKSTYEQNVLDYQAQDDLISAEAQRQRNRLAAQNDIQRMYMNEMGIMQGLNTGATGQMALAQSAALQGNLANIGTQEAQSLADNALALSKLKAQYSAAVDQATAEGKYQLAQALYEEWVRQDTLARQQQASAQEQANWQAQFNYQQAKDALAQQNWQAQFDYQKQQDDLNYQLTLQKLYGANVGSTGSPVKTPSVGYNNGSLTTAQVIQLQQDLNKYLPDGQKIAVDGKWGPATQAAAGGYTADEYARVYYKQNSWSGRSDR